VIGTVTPNPGLDRTLTVPRIAFNENEMVRATTSRAAYYASREDRGLLPSPVSGAAHAEG
jgi:hypothetical protein